MITFVHKPSNILHLQLKIIEFQKSDKLCPFQK